MISPSHPRPPLTHRFGISVLLLAHLIIPTVTYSQSPIVMSEARAQMRRGNYENADLILERALLERPNQPAYLTLQGLAALRLENHPRAKDLFQRAALYDPTNPLAHLNLGEVNALMGNHAEALSAYEKVPENSDVHPMAIYRQVICLIHLGMIEAAEIRTKTIKISEKNPAFYYAHAAVAFARGEFEQGRYFSESALRLHNPQSQVYRIPLIEAGWLSR